MNDEGARGEELAERARIAQATGDFQSLDAIARTGVSYARVREDWEMLAIAYRWLGTARHYLGDPKAAEAAYTSALDVAREHGEQWQAALAMICLGNVALEQHNDLAEGRRLHELAEPIIRASNDLTQRGILTGNLSEIARVEGDYDGALSYAHESLALFREAGDPHRAGWQLTNIALIHALRRDSAKTHKALREAWTTLEAAPNAYWVAMYFDICFMIATTLQRWELAGELHGFAEKTREELRVPRLLGLMNAWYPPAIEKFLRSLPPERIEALRERGAALTGAGAVEEICRALVAAERP